MFESILLHYSVQYTISTVLCHNGCAAHKDRLRIFNIIHTIYCDENRILQTQTALMCDDVSLNFFSHLSTVSVIKIIFLEELHIKLYSLFTYFQTRITEYPYRQ